MRASLHYASVIEHSRLGVNTEQGIVLSLYVRLCRLTHATRSPQARCLEPSVDETHVHGLDDLSASCYVPHNFYSFSQYDVPLLGA